MNIKEVKDLIQDVLQSDICEFELEHTGTRVRMKRDFSRDRNEALAGSAASGTSGAAAARASVPAAAPAEDAEDAEEKGLHVVTSPIVGVFYRAPKPDAEPYVRPGDRVREGSVLCIVEAMKLMNEILSDVEGEIVRIYVENGRPVEFGQKLFAVLPQQG